MENKYTHGVLFYHEHSGLKNINQGIGEVTTALSSICKHLSIQLSENEGDIIKYCQEIKTKNYAKDVDILFILGGDGTVNELINGVMSHDLQLPIGILPGGTFNDFTKTLNIAPNHKQASEQMISAQDGSKDIFGKLSYIGSTVKTLLNPTQFNYQLSIDDKTYSGETTMILTANGPFIGGSRIPLTDLSPQDGELNTFIFNEQSFSILNDIFKKRDSMNWNEITQGIEHIPGKKISLTTDPAMKVDIDGEISLETPIDIEVIPNAIQLLTVNDL
ncbi:TPA: diacylglycerol kinase family lipid kinase [Staphylococcus aureus]|nr:diacylglycerol kinase family lipid kinase [Staphylococcus aureus]